jgi:hypothetical protein
MIAMTPENAELKIVGIHISHSDDTGSRSVALPARSLLIDVGARCTESAGGTTRPSMDFGILGGDTNGVFDGLGESGVCDVAGDWVENEPEYRGRGALMTNGKNAHDILMKTGMFNSSETTYTLTRANAGSGSVTGEWDIYLIYIMLPVIS